MAIGLQVTGRQRWLVAGGCGELVDGIDELSKIGLSGQRDHLLAQVA